MSQNNLKKGAQIEIISAIFIIVFVSAFILANFFIGFSLPIYLTAMAVSFTLSFLYPRAGLYAIVFSTMIFERFFTLASIYVGRVEYKLYPIDVIILAMFLGLILNFLQMSKGDRQKVRLLGNDWTLLGFTLFNMTYFLVNIFIVKADSSLAFSSLKNYGFYSLLYFISAWLMQTREDFKRLAIFFLSGALGIIGFIVFGILNGNGLWTEYTPLSTFGVRILAFTHGLYLSLAFVAVTAYLIAKANGSRNKYLYWILPIWLVGIVGSMMRHLWISIIIALISIYFVIPKENKQYLHKMFWFSLLTFFSIAIFVFYAMTMVPNSKSTGAVQNALSAIVKRGASIANASSDESFAWRELVWGAAYKDFAKNPLLGIGTGKMVYVETRDYRDFIEVRNIHNSYLAIMIQLGIIGFGLLVFFIFKNILNLVVFIKSQKAKLSNAVAILGVLVIYVVALVFQPYLETNLLAIFFWIALGLSRNIVGYKL